jgi:hypothetical protein
LTAGSETAGIDRPQWRFDVVVFNYGRARSFLDNTSRIQGWKPNDRLSFVTASPSAEEESLVRDWSRANDVEYRYLPRKNRGIDQLARCEYFTGTCGGPGNLSDSRFIMQMQEHYLDATSPWSIWDERLDFRIKGDVIPDLTLDLNEIEKRMDADRCVAAFADRNNPCWIERNGERHIAPCGGNFIFRTEMLRSPELQQRIQRVASLCDDTYQWALFAEFNWGVLFFRDGVPVYDIKRDKVFTHFNRSDFYIASDDVESLWRRYGTGLWPAIMRAYWRARRVLSRLRRRSGHVNAA